MCRERRDQNDEGSDQVPLVAAGDPLATEATVAVQSGHLDALALALVGDRNCPHVAARGDRLAGHFPNGPAVVDRLVRAGADADARWVGDPAPETPLHWALCWMPGPALKRLGGPWGRSPLADACGFGNWAAARRLVERGARTRLEANVPDRR
ncbi:MAG: hypothetical protein ACRDYA_15355 [Egibacteraceae bacterium]